MEAAAAVGAAARWQWRRHPRDRSAQDAQVAPARRSTIGPSPFDELQRRNKTLTPGTDRRAQRLGEEQGVLADLVRDLTRPKRDDGEE